jgi:uncharacterized RDD family membrane protein YckC
MFCPKCGQLNLDKAQSCQKCGARLPASDGTSPAAAVPQAIVATGIYAGFWKRFAALIIDYLVVVVLSVLAGAVVGFLYGIASSSADKESAEGLGGLAGLAVWWLYYALMESSGKQATLGKMALGIKVVDRQGARVSFARATGRHFAKLLSGMIMMIGYMMAGFTSRKQALHDMVAGCLVVNRGAPEDLVQQGVTTSGMPVWAIVLIVLAVLVVPVGILAAVALPAYQDYTVRAKVSAAVQAGRQATVAIEEFHVVNNKLPGDLKDLGLPAPDPRHVRSVTMDPRSGAVRVVLAVSSLEGKSILFEPTREPDGRITWTCGSSDVQQRYLTRLCSK